jgi:hypothetical protein
VVFHCRYTYFSLLNKLIVVSTVARYLHCASSLYRSNIILQNLFKMFRHLATLVAAASYVCAQTVTVSGTVYTLPATSAPASSVVSFSCVPSPTVTPGTTIINVVIVDICATGFTTMTQAVTQTCPGNCPVQTGCPNGFTTVEKVCTVCQGGPITTTVTTPIASVQTAAVQTAAVQTGATCNGNCPSPSMATAAGSVVVNSAGSIVPIATGTSTPASPSHVITNGADSVFASAAIISMALFAGVTFVL